MEELKRRRSDTDLYVPEEILSNILVRLPVKHIVSFQTVCKPWRALITSHDFAKLHLDYSKRSPCHEDGALVFQGTDGSLYAASLDSNCVPQAVKLDLVVLDDVFRHIISCCNGLVLCQLKCNTRELRLVLVNPSTSLFKRLPILQLPKNYGLNFGFGYDHMTDEYKVVLIIHIAETKTEKDRDEMLIYSSRANSWFKFTDDLPLTRSFSCNGVLMNNHLLHWYTSDDQIFSFDVSTNKWSEVPLPATAIRYKVTEIGVSNGLLCVSAERDICGRYVYPPEYVYVMKEYGVKDSWEHVLHKPQQHSNKYCSWKIAPISNYAQPAQGQGHDVLLMSFRGGKKAKVYWYLKQRKIKEVPVLNCPQKLHYTACTRTLVSLSYL